MLSRNKLLIGLSVASLMILFSECDCIEDMMDKNVKLLYEIKKTMNVVFLIKSNLKNK